MCKVIDPFRCQMVCVFFAVAHAQTVKLLPSPSCYRGGLFSINVLCPPTVAIASPGITLIPSGADGALGSVLTVGSSPVSPPLHTPYTTAEPFLPLPCWFASPCLTFLPCLFPFRRRSNGDERSLHAIRNAPGFVTRVHLRLPLSFVFPFPCCYYFRYCQPSHC